MKAAPHPRRASLVLVPGSSATRQAAIASYRAARMSTSRASSQPTLALNPLSMTGMLLVLFERPVRALATVEGSDDYAAMVRNYLRRVRDEERAP